mgnify:FL=1
MLVLLLLVGIVGIVGLVAMMVVVVGLVLVDCRVLELSDRLRLVVVVVAVCHDVNHHEPKIDDDCGAGVARSVLLFISEVDRLMDG